MSTTDQTTPDTQRGSEPSGPRPWRDRTTYRLLADLLLAGREGEQADDETLSAAVTAARPNDEQGYVEAVVAAANEAVERWETGDQGGAREVIRAKAEEIDEKFETDDVQRDRAAARKTDRAAARQAAVDPDELAKGVPTGRMR